MDDVTKAAERLRRTNEGEFLCNVYETIEAQPMGELYELFQKDKESVVAAYLAEHPADDAEPLTEPWLRSVGGKDGVATAGIWLNNTIGFRLDDLADVVVCNARPKNVKTRGDLRRLAAALGIQLATP